MASEETGSEARQTEADSSMQVGAVMLAGGMCVVCLVWRGAVLGSRASRDINTERPPGSG